MAQLVIAAAGAVVGSFVGMPQLGFAIGSLIGSAFAPKQKQEGPRLTDLKVSGTETGAPIPYFDGKNRTAGQIAWASDRREIATTTEQGKGGGVESTTYTYEVDLLYLLSDCEMATFARVWNNGKLVYNNLPSASVGTAVASETTELWRRITFYSGSATQLPDPVYEAAVGIGNAPAYRGRATIFIEGLQLGGSGQIPNLSFEVFRETTLADVSLTFASFTRPNPIGEQATAVYENTAWYYSQDTNTSSNNYDFQKSKNFGAFAFKRRITLNPRYAAFTPVWVQTTGTPQAVYFTFNTVTFAGGVNIEAIDPETGIVSSIISYVPTAAAQVCNPARRYVAFDPTQNVYVICSQASGVDITSPFIVRSGSYIRGPSITGLTAVAAQGGYWYALADSGGFWRVRRYDYLGTFVDEVVDSAGAFSASGTSTNTNWLRVDADGQTWVFNALRGRLFKVGTIFEEVSTASNVNTYNTSPQDGVFYCEQPFAAFGADVAGLVLSYTFRRFKCPTAVQPTIQAVVERLCARADLDASQYDASGLSTITRPVRSMAISQVTPIRSVIETLAGAYYFGGALSDKIYFRPRGSASVATIPYENLGAGEGAAAAEPLNLKLSNDLEIPAQIALTYSNVDGDYNVATEYSDRLLTGQTSTSTVQLPLGLQPSEAKGTVDSLVADSAAAIFSTTISVFNEYARIEPTDVVSVIDEDGSSYRMRVTRKTESGPVISLDLVLDDASALSASGITSTAYTDSTSVTGKSDTLLRLLDIPILRDADDDVGIYAAFAGESIPWAGAALYKSADDAIYTLTQSATDATGMGATTNALTTWAGGFVFDESSSVTVLMDSGTLSSYTRDQIFDSTAPAYLIGNEIVYAKTATLISANTYTLTGFLRGMRGTEWAMSGHTAGELFTVLSSSGLRREPMTTSEIGAIRYFKAPTLGRALSTADAQPITLASVGQKPFSPVGLRAQRVGDPDSSSNVLLLHCDGINGSTTITDSSPAARTVTAFGSAQLSTAQSKFGSASLLFNGSNSYISAPTGVDFQFPGDFTIEAWVYPTTASLTSGAVGVIFSHYAVTTNLTGLVLYQQNQTVRFFSNGDRITSSAVLLANTWQHVAVSRVGTSIRLFVNGTQQGTTYVAASNYSDGRCFIGRDSITATQYFSGSMDEIRITKGVGRYASNFIVPSAAFPETSQTTISWDRRTRLAKNFTNGYVPLGEAVESYSVDVWSDNTYSVLKRTLTSASPSVDYSNALQTTDFGSVPATLYIDVYQVSAAIGRGTKLRGAV
jgi:hypothetical protein